MDKWLKDEIIERALEIENEKKDPLWFSIASISKVPYISFPDLSPKECKELQEQAKEVLRISRNKNHFKEVAITYDLRSSNENKYKIVLGNISSAKINEDRATKELLTTTDSKSELAVICIHNHPNNSMFSISDLLVFSLHPSIKIMEIINRNGEVSFLLRPQFEKYDSIIDVLIDAEPGFIQKLQDFHNNSRNKNFQIRDIIEDIEVRKEVAKEMITVLESHGVYVHDYVNQEQANQIDFSTFVSSEKRNQDNNREQFVKQNDYVYLENGEDGYEWEER